MNTKLPKWIVGLVFLTWAGFAWATGNGDNSFTQVWSATSADDGDVYWGVSGPFDFDGDGYEELVSFSDYNGITLHLFENTADNTWEEKWTYNITNVIYSYEVCNQEADLDRDGLPEMIVGGKAGRSGDYDGLFFFELDTNATDVAFNLVASVQPLAMINNGNGGSATAIYAGDLDDDGVEEVLIHETENDYEIIFSLDTTSTYEFPNWNVEFVDSTLTYSSFGIVVGDFDADGTMNFAVSEWDYNGIAFYQVDGPDEYSNIYYSDDITTTDGGSLRSMRAADVDGDGFDELLLPSIGGGFFVMTNNGDLSAFDPATDFHEIYWGDSTGFRGGDVGNPDIWRSPSDGMDVITNQGGSDNSRVVDFEFTGTDPGDPASWTQTIIYPTDSTTRWQDVAIGDFDNDGIGDIAVVSRTTPTIMVLEHNAYASEPSESRPVVSDYDNNTPGFQTRGILAGTDLDQDGKPEVIITDYTTHGVHVYEVTGDNTLEWVFSTPQDDSTTYWATPRWVIATDLDNDGLGEFTFYQMRTPGPTTGVSVWEWDGQNDNSYLNYVIHLEIDGVEVDRYYGERTLNVGDPDQDGQQEIFIANNGSDHAYDVFIIASLDGTFESGFYSLNYEYVASQAEGVFGGSPGYGLSQQADLDGDGQYEVIFPCWDNAGIYIVEATGPNTYEFQTFVYLDSTMNDRTVYGATTVADVDGDGHDEMYGGLYSPGWLWRVEAGDDVSQISYDDGTISLVSDWGAVWDVTSGDWNGDGNTEIFSVDYTHGRIYEWSPSAGDWGFKVVANWPFTMGGFALAYAGDMDGDGYNELVQGFLEPPYSSGNPNGYTFAVVEATATGVRQDWRVITPDDYKLAQNYPNPFNPSTTIEFTLPIAKEISLVVYNLKGQEVVRLADNKHFSAGTHTLIWNGRDAAGRPVASGVYIYQLRAGNVVKSHRMTLLR